MKGHFAKPQNLGSTVNSAQSEYDPFIAFDESRLIFASSGRADSFGKADLYWSIAKQDGWHATKHFGPSINTSTRDYCPYVSKDKGLFFYSSGGDIKFIETKYMPNELSKE